MRAPCFSGTASAIVSSRCTAGGRPPAVDRHLALARDVLHLRDEGEHPAVPALQRRHVERDTRAAAGSRRALRSTRAVSGRPSSSAHAPASRTTSLPVAAALDPQAGAARRPRLVAHPSSSPPSSALSAFYLLVVGTTRLGTGAPTRHDELHALAACEPQPLDVEAERRQLARRRIARPRRPEPARAPATTTPSSAPPPGARLVVIDQHAAAPRRASRARSTREVRAGARPDRRGAPRNATIAAAADVVRTRQRRRPRQRGRQHAAAPGPTTATRPSSGPSSARQRAASARVTGARSAS